MTNERSRDTRSGMDSDASGAEIRSYFELLHSRRALIAGTATGVTALAVAYGESGAIRQDSSPVASPQGSPAASPAATPAGTPVPPPVLKTVTDQVPVYAGPPLRTDQLRLFVTSANLTDFSPAAFRQDPQISFSYLEPLVRSDNVSMEPVPHLAESWSWNAKGTELSFKLRSGVTWHDGTPVTAQDASFSLNVYMLDYDSVVSRFFSNVARVVPDDDRTVRVVFEETDGAFLFNAATLPIFQRDQYVDFWNENPAPSHTLSGFDWTKHGPIGSGPWKIDKVSDDAISLVANEEYWDDRPYADTLILTAQDDPEIRVEAWKKGDVDIVYPVTPDMVAGLLQEHGTLYVADAPVTLFAAFNFDNPANATADMMKDSAVRQALSLAIDRNAYGVSVFGGFISTDMAGTITQPWAHDSGIVNPARNVAAAQKLLSEAGWTDIDDDGLLEDDQGNKLDLYCIVSTSERVELLELLDLLDANLNEIGVRLTIQRLEPADFRDRWMNNRQYDLIATSLVQYPAFAEFDLYGSAWDIRTNSVGWNPGGYANDDVDAAIQAWFDAFEIEDMRDALMALQDAANKDLFGLWFGFPRDLMLVREDIQGYLPNKLWQTADTRQIWRVTANGTPATPVTPYGTPVPLASPAASPVASPAATPAT